MSQFVRVRGSADMWALMVYKDAGTAGGGGKPLYGMKVRPPTAQPLQAPVASLVAARASSFSRCSGNQVVIVCVPQLMGASFQFGGKSTFPTST